MELLYADDLVRIAGTEELLEKIEKWKKNMGNGFENTLT